MQGITAMDKVHRLRIDKERWEKRRSRLLPILALGAGALFGTISGIDQPLRIGTIFGFALSGAIVFLSVAFYIICLCKVRTISNKIKRA